MTAAVMTDLLLLVSLACLVWCIVKLRREGSVVAARLTRLEDVLTRLSREELDAGVRISRVERTLRETRARQDSLEHRATSGPRIESAVRVARRGAATESMLRDLGLSDAEASLLLRLHADGEDEPDGSDGPQAATARTPNCQAASLARLLAENASAEPQAQTA